MSVGYKGNQVLIGPKDEISLDAEQLAEYVKCSENPLHFIKEHVKIVNVDKGLVPFSMWPFQEKMVNMFHSNRFNIVKLPRQQGKSSTVMAYLLYYALFNENVVIAILAHKGSTARELLSRLRRMYETLPIWMKQGVVRWNQGDIEFGNGSKILAAATTSSAIRGFSINLLYLDEFAFVPTGQADDFFRSVYPTISSGKSTKIIMTSTPNGLNMFYRIWMDAVEGRNAYKYIDAHWSEVPGRDEAWKAETISNIGVEKWRIEYEAEFLGSSNTLISGHKLRQMRFTRPLRVTDNDAFYVYEDPIKAEPKRGIPQDHTYAITVDPSRGQNQDYSAFSVFDISEIPYKQVAKFRDKTMSPLVLPTMIYNAAKYYNDAFVLVEISDNGQQIADMLHYELEYDNLVKIVTKGKQGQFISAGHTKKMQFGLKQSTATKRMGCSNLKVLIETDKLLIPDADTILELTTFIAQKESFAAEEGNHDDLAMTLVIFSWFVNQRFIKESIKNNIREVLQKEMTDLEDEDLLEFYVDDHGAEQYDQLMNLRNAWQDQRRASNPFEGDYENLTDDWRELLLGPDEVARQNKVLDGYKKGGDGDNPPPESKKDTFDSKPIEGSNPWHKETFDKSLKNILKR